MFFFFKQKTAYEMRISDWSSDVCSSDLVEIRIPIIIPVMPNGRPTIIKRMREPFPNILTMYLYFISLCASIAADAKVDAVEKKIGRASCRERVCQYV